MVSTKELIYVFKTKTANKMLHTYTFTLTRVDKETLEVLFQMTWVIIEKNEMGRACSMYGGGERRVQGFGGET
jgi:hypothetical protein